MIRGTRSCLGSTPEDARTGRSTDPSAAPPPQAERSSGPVERRPPPPPRTDISRSAGYSSLGPIFFQEPPIGGLVRLLSGSWRVASKFGTYNPDRPSIRGATFLNRCIHGHTKVIARTTYQKPLDGGRFLQRHVCLASFCPFACSCPSGSHQVWCRRGLPQRGHLRKRGVHSDEPQCAGDPCPPGRAPKTRRRPAPNAPGAQDEVQNLSGWNPVLSSKPPMRGGANLLSASVRPQTAQQWVGAQDRRLDYFRPRPRLGWHRHFIRRCSGREPRLNRVRIRAGLRGHIRGSFGPRPRERYPHACRGLHTPRQIHALDEKAPSKPGGCSHQGLRRRRLQPTLLASCPAINLACAALSSPRCVQRLAVCPLHQHNRTQALLDRTAAKRMRVPAAIWAPRTSVLARSALDSAVNSPALAIMGSPACTTAGWPPPT